jgi:hypothetical protein
MPLPSGERAMHPSLSPAARHSSELRLLGVLLAVQAGALAVYLDSTSATHAPRCARATTYKVIKPVYNSLHFHLIKFSYASDATVLRRCVTAVICVVSVLLSPHYRLTLCLQCYHSATMRRCPKHLQQLPQTACRTCHPDWCH